MFANLVGVKWYIKVPLICLIIVRENMPVGANISICVMGFPQPLSYCSGLYFHSTVSLCLSLHSFLSLPVSISQLLFWILTSQGGGPFIKVSVSPA